MDVPTGPIFTRVPICLVEIGTKIVILLEIEFFSNQQVQFVYLKRKRRKNQDHYILSESYHEDGIWKYRKLMDLGADPAEYIVYPGGNAFYIKESLEETLNWSATDFSYDELEALFMPFLKPRIRRIVESFQRRGPIDKHWKAMNPETLYQYQNRLHDFDKRRLHYLRYGRVEIGKLEGRSWPFLNVLLERSRDEIEHVIQGMETDISPYEIRPYLYTALNLQTHFQHLLTRFQPAALDPEKVNEHFVKDLFRLNRDKHFFIGVEDHDPDTLHAYLVKYLDLYFNHTFDPDAVREEYIQDFIWRHQFYRPPRHSHELSGTEKKACEILAITQEDFKGMTRRELIKCYRIRAKETHPDMGGKREVFVQVQEAYECLIKQK